MQFRSVRHDRRGYTLGELLWVIVILGVITALAVPKLDWMKYRLNAEQRNIAGQLSYAQRLAVSLQHNVQVTIDNAQKRLLVDEDANNDGTYTSNERRRVIQLTSGLNFSQNGVTSLPAPAPANQLTTIIYRRDGSADQSGVIFMNTDRGVAAGVPLWRDTCRAPGVAEPGQGAHARHACDQAGQRHPRPTQPESATDGQQREQGKPILGKRRSSGSSMSCHHVGMDFRIAEFSGSRTLRLPELHLGRPLAQLLAQRGGFFSAYFKPGPEPRAVASRQHHRLVILQRRGLD